MGHLLQLRRRRRRRRLSLILLRCCSQAAHLLTAHSDPTTHRADRRRATDESRSLVETCPSKSTCCWCLIFRWLDDYSQTARGNNCVCPRLLRGQSSVIVRRSGSIKRRRRRRRQISRRLAAVQCRRRWSVACQHVRYADTPTHVS